MPIEIVVFTVVASTEMLTNPLRQILDLETGRIENKEAPHVPIPTKLLKKAGGKTPVKKKGLDFCSAFAAPVEKKARGEERSGLLSPLPKEVVELVWAFAAPLPPSRVDFAMAWLRQSHYNNNNFDEYDLIDFAPAGVEVQVRCRGNCGFAAAVHEGLDGYCCGKCWERAVGRRGPKKKHCNRCWRSWYGVDPWPAGVPFPPKTLEDEFLSGQWKHGLAPGSSVEDWVAKSLQSVPKNKFSQRFFSPQCCPQLG